MLTTTNAAAVRVLIDLRTIHAERAGKPVGCPAMLWDRAIDRAARSGAFRLLNRKGLIEESYKGGTTAKLWRLSALGLAVQHGEELSAIL